MAKEEPHCRLSGCTASSWDVASAWSHFSSPERSKVTLVSQGVIFKLEKSLAERWNKIHMVHVGRVGTGNGWLQGLHKRCQVPFPSAKYLSLGHRAEVGPDVVCRTSSLFQVTIHFLLLSAPALKLRAKMDLACPVWISNPPLWPLIFRIKVIITKVMVAQ